MKVVSGRNLAVRDMVTSDPYVVLSLGQQVCEFIRPHTFSTTAVI